MALNAVDIKKLREMTSAGFADCKNALEESKGDIKKAAEILKEKGIAKAGKKGDRATEAGLVEAYVHMGKIGSMIEVMCETDFVARTDEFKHLAHELAMQVASMNPDSSESLMKQAYIREPGKTIEDLVKEHIAKLGENITLGRLARIELGVEE